MGKKVEVRRRINLPVVSQGYGVQVSDAEPYRHRLQQAMTKALQLSTKYFIRSR